MIYKVSIIIPFYNNAEWLVEAVESALNQTYKNIEIIIVNDGSDEDMTSFLHKYEKSITYRYQENEGAASARNHAMSLASGDYFAFLDSDDVWLPTKLEKQIFFMEQTGAKWSHTNYFYWNPAQNSLKDVAISDEYGDIFKKTFVSIKMATPSVVVNAEVFKINPELCFPESYRIGQDTQLWRKISKLYPIALLKEPLVKVRLRQDNTFKQTVLKIQHRAKGFEKIKENPDVPTFAKFQGAIYYAYSKIFKLPSSPLKDFLARGFSFFPYAIGRAYVKYLSVVNKKNKHFVC